MQIIINTDNNMTVINKDNESAMIVDGKLNFDGTQISLTSDQINQLNDITTLANNLTSNLFGKKKISKICYTNGVFTISDIKSNIIIKFENDLTTEQKVFTDAFKVICNNWVTDFKVINFTAPGTIIVDNIIKIFRELPQEEQITIGAVGEIMTTILNS